MIPYNGVFDKLTTVLTILIEERNLPQSHNVPSEPIVTEDSLSRKRTVDNEDK